MPAAGPSGRPLPRRTVLRVVGATATGVLAATLAGCDIRLQDDAPSIPGLQRKSVPDEAVVVDAVRRTQTLTQLAGRIPAPPAAVATVAALHAAQTEVLRGRLTNQGVPNHVIDTTPTPASGAPTPTAAVSAPATATATELLASEQALLASLLGALPTVTSANLPILASVAAQSGAAVEILGASPTWPAAEPLPATVATTFLADVRAAAYAFQVVAAQSTGDQRTAGLTTHTELEAAAATLAATAGPTAPAAPLGYALPFPVTDQASAQRLAATVLTTLVAGGLAPLSQVPTGSSAMVGLVRYAVDAERWARSWGVGPVPFPGLAYP